MKFEKDEYLHLNLDNGKVLRFSWKEVNRASHRRRKWVKERKAEGDHSLTEFKLTIKKVKALHKKWAGKAEMPTEETSGETSNGL